MSNDSQQSHAQTSNECCTGHHGSQAECPVVSKLRAENAKLRQIIEDYAQHQQKSCCDLPASEKHFCCCGLTYALWCARPGAPDETKAEHWTYESVGYRFLHHDAFGHPYWTEHHYNPNGGSPIASQEVFVRVHQIPQREGDNRAVSTERCQSAAAVPETSGSYSRSDPSEDARTPAGAGSASPVVCDLKAGERI
jgi:hypothetical protein